MVARPGALIVVMAVVLGGCVAPVYEPEPAPRPVPRPAPPVPAPTPPSAPGGTAETPVEPAPTPTPELPPPPSSGATAALLAQGRAQAAGGDYVMATASLERALRINPRDAELWCELGRVKLRQGDVAQAQSMAQRGLAVAGNDAARRAQCEAVLATARRGR